MQNRLALPMVATAISRQFRPDRHRHLLLQSSTSSIQFSSSSSSSNSDDHQQNETPSSQSQYSSPLSLLKEVKASLKGKAQSSLQPRRQSFFDSNPSAGDAAIPKVCSLEEIRENLRSLSSVQPATWKVGLLEEIRKNLGGLSSVQPPSSSSPTISFQERYKRNVMLRTDPWSNSEDASKTLCEEASMIVFRSLQRNQRRLRKLRPEVKRNIGFEGEPFLDADFPA